MTNPAPRPALRKAEDSTVHPAAPVRPARSRDRATGAGGGSADGSPHRSGAAAPVPRQPAPADARPAASRKAADSGSADASPAPSRKAGPSGSAGKGTARPGPADGGRRGSDAGTGGREAAARAGRRGGKRRAFSGATSDHLRPEAVVAAAEVAARKKRKQAFTDVDLMRGKTVDLGVTVPKRLRKAARAEAKRRGLDLDAVTTELLHRWLTGR